MELNLMTMERQSTAAMKMRFGVTIFQINARILAMITVVLLELTGAPLMDVLNSHAVTSLHSIVLLKITNA